MDQDYSQQGDLTDILRPTIANISGGGSVVASTSSTRDQQRLVSAPIMTDHQPNTNSDFALFNSLIKYQSSGATRELAADDFGDPFSHMQDPLLLNNELINSGSSSFFFTASSDRSTAGLTSTVDLDRDCNAGGGDDQMMIMMRRQQQQQQQQQQPSLSSCDVFSRMLRISPTRPSSASTSTPPLNIKAPCTMTTSTSSAGGALLLPPRETSIFNISNNIDNNISNNNNGLQQIIASPRNPAIKRRKSQAKKVVCIPAPAPVNSRPSGEIVPCDLWAWRKYGQKPIKGSPYPRGYYRCSSSKGCLARKQVERSRTDPNMLVITYTSEHNHPWPTQRNALAGSTRAQPSTKTNTTSHRPNDLNEDRLRDDNDATLLSTSNNARVKYETKDMDMDMDMDMDEGFSPSYKPAMPDSDLGNPSENFYDELDEIETDPIRLMLHQDRKEREDHDQNKGLYLFNVFDWPGNSKRSL